MHRKSLVALGSAHIKLQLKPELLDCDDDDSDNDGDEYCDEDDFNDDGYMDLFDGVTPAPPTHPTHNGNVVMLTTRRTRTNKKV